MEAAYFIDNEFRANTLFYSYERDEQKKCDQKFINALMLYTLSPGETSTFKDIRLCPDLCPGTEDLGKLDGESNFNVWSDPFVALTESTSFSVRTVASAITCLSLLSVFAW